MAQTDQPQPGRRWDVWVAAATVVVSLVVYLLTLAPTVTVDDSGELITAAVSLGVPHPPGYPLWCLLGKAFSLLPLGSPAWRINLMSGVFAALTVGGVCLACRRMGAGRLPSAAAALCLAFSRRFWAQAVVAEVYALNSFMLCAVVLLLLWWAESRRASLLYGAAAVFGLSLSNHYMLMLLVSPALALFVVWSEPKLLRRARPAAACAGIVLAALVVYAYLPLAARCDPPLNWGDPRSLGSFWHHVTRKQFRGIDFAAGFSLVTKLRLLGHFAGLLWRQFTPVVVVPLGLLGCLALRGRRREALLLGGVAACNVGLLLAVTRFPYEPVTLTRVEQYYAPAYLCAAVVVGMGLSRLTVAAARRGKAALAVAAAACLAAPLCPLVAHWRANDMSDHYLAYDYNVAILESLEPDAVYFPGLDFAAFPSIYLQAVEGLRPDVLLANYTGKISPETRPYVARLDPRWRHDDTLGAQRLMVERGERPVYFGATAPLPPGAPWRMDPWGLVFRVQPKGRSTPSEAPDPFAGSALRNLPVDVPLTDQDRALLSSCYLLRAETLMSRGEFDEAAARYREAADYMRHYTSYLNNIAILCMRRHLNSLAEELLTESVKVDADNAEDRLNLAGVYERQWRLQEALQQYLAVTRLDPADERAAARARAITSVPAGQRPAALAQRVERTRAALGSAPDDPELLRTLGDLMVLEGDPRTALASYKRALEADPGHQPTFASLAAFYDIVVMDSARAAEWRERGRESGK